eukprot:COSAG03_NODE_11_length_23018_cov_29.686461_19_plen_82_part_00
MTAYRNFGGMEPSEAIRRYKAGEFEDELGTDDESDENLENLVDENLENLENLERILRKIRACDWGTDECSSDDEAPEGMFS